MNTYETEVTITVKVFVDDFTQEHAIQQIKEEVIFKIEHPIFRIRSSVEIGEPVVLKVTEKQGLS